MPALSPKIGGGVERRGHGREEPKIGGRRYRPGARLTKKETPND